MMLRGNTQHYQMQKEIPVILRFKHCENENFKNVKMWKWWSGLLHEEKHGMWDFELFHMLLCGFVVLGARHVPFSVQLWQKAETFIHGWVLILSFKLKVEGFAIWSQLGITQIYLFLSWK